MQCNVSLDTIARVKAFSEQIITCKLNATLYSGRHRVNAKSILGVLSIDLTEPLLLEIHDEEPYDREDMQKMLAIIEPFKVDSKTPFETLEKVG